LPKLLFPWRKSFFLQSHRREQAMPFTNTQAAACGLLAMYAMDTYRVATSSLTPAPAPGLTASGWTIMAYITGKDSLFPNGQLQVTSQTVCYGYLARHASGEMVAVIRGTDGFVEWIEDATFVPISYAPQIALPAGSGALEVEQGFWTL
jgi:hypothetical protein